MCWIPIRFFRGGIQNQDPGQIGKMADTDFINKGKSWKISRKKTFFLSKLKRRKSDSLWERRNPWEEQRTPQETEEQGHLKRTP